MYSKILQGPEAFLHGPQTQREVVGVSPLQLLPLLPSSWVNLDGWSLADHLMASSLICVPQLVRRVKVTLSHSTLHPALCHTVGTERLPSAQLPTEPQSKGTGQACVHMVSSTGFETE